MCDFSNKGDSPQTTEPASRATLSNMEVDEGVDVEEKVVPEERTFPVMSLAQTAFQLESTSPTADKVATKAKVMAAVEADTMTPYYEALCAKFGWAVDADLLARLKCVGVWHTAPVSLHFR